MRDEFISYFDKYSLMKPHGMNDIVYTTQFMLLHGGLTEEQCHDAFSRHFVDGELVNSDGSSPISHDNLTALTCLASKMNLLPKLNFSPGHAYWHPRDLIFYAYVNGSGIIRLFGFLLFWITSLCMIVEIGIDTYKTIGGKQVLATDGILLGWIRINSISLPVTKFICNKIAHYKHGGYQFYFETYFPSDHPNVILAKEQGI